MKEIVKHLKENREIAAAREILLSEGYAVRENKKETQSLRESVNADWYADLEDMYKKGLEMGYTPKEILSSEAHINGRYGIDYYVDGSISDIESDDEVRELIDTYNQFMEDYLYPAGKLDINDYLE